MSQNQSLVIKTGFLSWIVLLSTFSTAIAFPRVELEDSTPIIKVAEGFGPYSESVPDSVKAAWNSVFVLYVSRGNDSKIGTAFLVDRKDKGGVVDLYFLTSFHTFFGSCESAGLCKKTYLSPDFLMKVSDLGATLEFPGGKALENIEIVKVSKSPDLALLKVRVKMTKSLPKPLSISSSCNVEVREPLTSIGFSEVSSRINPQSAPISDSNSVYKRWAKGVSYGDFSASQTRQGGSAVWLSTTIDLIPGGSGGPVLNAQGEVVGVMENSKAMAKNGFKYFGDESQDHFTWHSNAVKCEDVSSFLKSAAIH